LDVDQPAGHGHSDHIVAVALIVQGQQPAARFLQRPAAVDRQPAAHVQPDGVRVAGPNVELQRRAAGRGQRLRLGGRSVGEVGRILQRQGPLLHVQVALERDPAPGQRQPAGPDLGQGQRAGGILDHPAEGTRRMVVADGQRRRTAGPRIHRPGAAQAVDGFVAAVQVQDARAIDRDIAFAGTVGNHVAGSELQGAIQDAQSPRAPVAAGPRERPGAAALLDNRQLTTTGHDAA